MSLFSAIGKWFKGTTQEVIDVLDPIEESTCACGGQCTCGDSSQQETVATASVTGEDSRLMQHVLEETQEEITAVVEAVIEEAEKVAEAVAEVVVDEVEEVTELTEEVIAAADEAAAEMLEDAKTSMPTTASVISSKPNIKRKRKASRKSRKKK